MGVIVLTIFLLCVLAALGVGVLAGVSDFRGLSIPNLYSLLIGGAFVVCYAVLWMAGRGDVVGSLSSHLLAAVAVFFLTFSMFAAKSLGAADSKLGTVYALWVGSTGLMPFLFYTALAGGVLGLAALGLRRWKPVKAPVAGSWVAAVQGGESKVPYGIAIVAGALASFVELGYFKPEVLASFLLT
jgi:prepilin peptidase CpaA